MGTSKKEEDSPPVEKSQQESSHRTFSEFLDCVRNFSVDERRAALKGPDAWMAEPLGPTRELDTADGKELLKYVWDRLPEFRAKEREAIQAYFVELLNGEDTRGIIIANAVRSCMLEHSDERESKDGQEKEIKQQIQDPQEAILATIKEHEDLEVENTLDRAPQLVTFEDIEAALDAGDRKKAVDLWQQLRKEAGKEHSKACLYRAAGQDKRDFDRWCKGEHPNGSTPDKDIRRALTTDWD